MRSRHFLPIGAAALCLLFTACGSTGTASRGGNPDLITVEEVEASNQSNAYELVRSRRPNWLSRRGTQSINLTGDIVVYLDATRLGGPEALRRISIHSVHSIRYFDASEATQRWGTGHGFGAIQVETR